eukprot:scaffold67937_cov16-Prasinocladus_malaysianus.AAC.1
MNIIFHSILRNVLNFPLPSFPLRVVHPVRGGPWVPDAPGVRGRDLPGQLHPGGLGRPHTRLWWLRGRGRQHMGGRGGMGPPQGGPAGVARLTSSTFSVNANFPVLKCRIFTDLRIIILIYRNIDE